MKKNIIIILTSAILATACTKEIEYKGPDSERMLVVNCITESGRIPVFKISHSAFFLDSYYTGNDIKSGVNVRVDINGTERDATYVDSLKGYTDGRAITDGDIISVTVSDPQFKTVQATDTVPQTRDFNISQYTKEFVQAKTMSEMFDDFFYDFDVEKVDSVWVTEMEIPSSSNRPGYYMITIDPKMYYFLYNEYEGGYDTMTQRMHFKIPAETKMLLGLTDATTAILEDTEADSQFEYGEHSYLFDDLYIKDGNTFGFDFVMEKPDTVGWLFTYENDSYITESTPYSLSGMMKDTVIYSIDIKLYALSNAYYLYHKSVNDYMDADEISFLSEPVTILHNIKGGAGILATYAGKSLHYERPYKFK